MKRHRWLLAAALMACAGIRLQAQSFDDWRLRGDRILGATPSRDLLLVHGLFSSSGTWLDLQYAMYAMGDTTWHVFTPDLYPSASFAVNRDSLVRYMYNMEVGNDVAVVGHSMGGIIGRLASRQHPTQGILTIGTPHTGARLAWALTADSWSNPFNQFLAVFDFFAVNAVCWLPWDSTDWESEWLSAWDVDIAKADAWQTIDDLLLVSSFIVAQAIGGFPAIEDLSPASAATADLRDGNLAEQTERRGSIVTSIGTGYLSGPFLLAWNGNRDQADNAGQVMQINGSRTFGSGLTLLWAADYQSPNYWPMIAAGFSLIELGLMEATYWAFWNYEIIGGIPNDAIVTSAGMIMPRSTNEFYPNTPVMHTEETSRLAEYLRTTINSLFNH